MTSSFRQDYPQPPPSATVDYFDLLPDSLLLVIFTNLKDIKSLGKCCVVSKRFQTLIPQVQNIMVSVDCVVSDNNTTKPYKPFSVSNILRQVLGSVSNFLRPMHGDVSHKQLKHHSPAHVLRNFKDVRELNIELPKGELDIEHGVLLKWRADFGSTLRNCMMLGASSVTKKLKDDGVNGIDNGSMPDSFYTNGGLKMRVVWTISTLIAASARHYLLKEIIDEHKTLQKLVLSDVDRQGVIRMNKEDMDELRVNPLPVSFASASNRTSIPALSMKLWYAPYLELSDGSVLKGATLVAIRPSEKLVSKDVNDMSWVEFEDFEEPYRTAARMLVKGKTYCLEMNAF